ncbi:MAG: mannose-1-phosphate guanylyltransferase [Solirubrobacterales bacterium]
MYAVILAGGSGERFWPLSRKEKPKQFLSLIGGQTMLQRTVERLDGLVRPDHQFIVAAAGFKALIAQQLPGLPEQNIICEPVGRDTAAAIGLAAEHIARLDPEGIMMVLPADHYIADICQYRGMMSAAAQAAASGQHSVTLGIMPTRPETGYGYICKGQAYASFDGKLAFRVRQFEEKPNLGRACAFLNTGNYLWNSGMFVWRVDLIRRLIQQHLPELHKGLQTIGALIGRPDEQRVLERVYADLPKISIDYGIMEKAGEVLVFQGEFGWDDVGSWTALERYADADENGNVLRGRGVCLDTRNSLIQTEDRVVATLGVEDLIVVDHGNSLLVCHKGRAQDIKQLVHGLAEAGYGHLL